MSLSANLGSCRVIDDDHRHLDHFPISDGKPLRLLCFYAISLAGSHFLDFSMLHSRLFSFLITICYYCN